MKSLKFSLLDNAMDSLRQGVGFALKEEPTKRDLKLSILLLAQAVELLLKERLKREHWSLVFKDIEQAGNSDANTVTITDAIKRLEQIAHVTFEPGEQDTISKFSVIRNRIQHYEIDITIEEVIGKAHSAIALITRFLKDEFDGDIRDYLDEDDVQRLLDVDEALEHVKEIARQNIKKIKKENEPIKASDRMIWKFDVLDCPQCWQEFYIFSPDAHISQCQLCKYDGGFIVCARCGYQAPSGSWDFHSEGADFAMCNNCWGDIVNKP